MFTLAGAWGRAQMGNKGAFIRFESDMVPHMTSFSAVVRFMGFH